MSNTDAKAALAANEAKKKELEAALKAIEQESRVRWCRLTRHRSRVRAFDDTASCNTTAIVWVSIQSVGSTDTLSSGLSDRALITRNTKGLHFITL